MSVPTVVGFDAQMFPHLIDSIFSYADGHNLLTLRTASREWCERANTLLLHHLLFRDKTVYAVDVDGQLTPHPAFEASLCSKFKWCLRNSSPEPSRWDEAMAGVHVIDCADGYAYQPPEGFLQVPVAFARFLKNQRVPPDETQRMAAETAVVFANPSRDILRASQELWTPASYVQAAATRKLVVNLTPSGNWLSPIHWWWEGKRNVKEVVLNLVTPSPSAADAVVTGKTTLLDALNAAVVISVPHTFVNTDALGHDALLSFLEKRCWDVLYPRTYAVLQQSKFLQEGVAVFVEESRAYRGLSGHAGKDIRFLTSAEYEAEVGTERFRIETMEEPWRV